MKRDRTSPRAKMILLYLILVLGFGIAILWASIKVIWVDGSKWRQKAESRTMNYIEQPAQRGNIYSSDGKILATTVPECDLYLDFGIRPQKDKNDEIMKDKKGDTIFYTPIHDTSYAKYLDSVCLILHEVFPDSAAGSFRNKIESERKKTKRGGCIRIATHVPYSDWDKICKFPGWSNGVVKYVDGQSVIHNKRFHTYGNMGECVIGFPTADHKKFTGLEGYYDSILRGQDGLVLCRRLTRGSWIPVERGTYIAASESDKVVSDSIPGHPVVDGLDIVATIDTRLQDIAHYSLENALRTLDGSAGCAILIEVETGNVLVCSSLVRDSAGRYFESPNRNVALSDLYEPGSIFKPVLLTAMYNDPSFTLDTAMLLPVGRKQFSAPTLSKEVMDHGLPNAKYPLWKAVAVSSNVAFCELGWRYYNNRRDSLLAQVKRVFPYDKLQPDIRGPENNCRVTRLKYDNDFLRFCYGYTSSVSPLRMATFYNAIANKGHMVKPRFCRAIIRNGKEEALPVQTMNEHICSPETATTLRDMLVGVVEGGTGDNIKNNTYTIAGKTGTAETSPGAPTSNVTFVGFFPADKPKYTCLVMMRDIYRFGRDAAPVFLEIADCVVSLDKELDCRPTVKKLAEMKQNKKSKRQQQRYLLPTIAKAPYIEVLRASKRLGLDYSNITHQTLWCTFRDPVDSLDLPAAYIEYHPPVNQIPNCYGMTIKDALLLCRSMGVDVTFEGFGKVYSQEPRGRTPITPGAKVHLKLRSGRL